MIYVLARVVGLRKVVGFKIEESLHRKLKHLAVDCGKDVSELAEMAIRLLLHLTTAGIPEDLALSLRKGDPSLLEKLKEVVA